MTDQPNTDRGWSTVPDSPRRAFGSALKGRHSNRIATPPLITERPRRLASEPPCAVCGDDGPYFCDCEESE